MSVRSKGTQDRNWEGCKLHSPERHISSETAYVKPISCHAYDLGGRLSARTWELGPHEWDVLFPDAVSLAVWNQNCNGWTYVSKSCFAGRVGKTSLVLRYVDNVFSDKQVATVQASYLTKRLTVDGESVTLSIWVQFPHLSFTMAIPVAWTSVVQKSMMEMSCCTITICNVFFSLTMCEGVEPPILSMMVLAKSVVQRWGLWVESGADVCNLYSNVSTPVRGSSLLHYRILLLF